MVIISAQSIRTSLSIRHGCKSVVQLEMMPKLPDSRAENNPWPEWPRVCKTDYGQEEAIAVFGHDPRIYQTTVKRFLKNDKNHVCAVEIVKLQSVQDPKTGRMRMEEIPGSEQILEADLVLIAAGFLGAQSYVADAFGVDMTSRTNVATEEGHYATSVEGVFTAGDMHRDFGCFRENESIKKRLSEWAQPLLDVFVTVNSDTWRYRTDSKPLLPLGQHLMHPRLDIHLIDPVQMLRD